MSQPDIEDTPATCEWSCEGDDCDYWSTGCGHAFVFNDGGPYENGLKFCGYCGKPLVEAKNDAE